MSKKSRSRLWFLVHSWLALPIWFFVLIVCVTGTLAVVSQEIVWLANPDVRASKPYEDAEPLSFSQVLKAINEAQPDLLVESIQRPDEEHFALTAEVSYPGGSEATLYINPYTGAIQGESPSFDFRQFTRALHGWWLVPFNNGYSWGWYMVSLLGLPMLASLITGLVVYKRFWKGFLKPRLRINQGARIFWGDFHRLSGIWSIWFIALISITGTWFLIQAILADNHVTLTNDGIPPVIARADVPRAAPGQKVPYIELDEAVRLVTGRIPSLEASAVFLPGNAYSPMFVAGRGWYPLMFQSAALNPYTGKIETTRLLSDRTPLQFVTESMRPLHTGDFGGIWVKLIWFVRPAAEHDGAQRPADLEQAHRTGHRRAGQARQAPGAPAETGQAGAGNGQPDRGGTAMSKAAVAQPVSPLRQFWLRWRFHLNVLLILIPLGFMPRYFADMALFSGSSGLGERGIGEVQVGPWSLKLAEWRIEPPHDEGPAGFMKDFNAALCQACIPQVKATYLRIGKPRSLRAAGVIFFGSPYRMGTSVPIPPRTRPDAELWITMEGWDGSMHQASIPLAEASPATVAWLNKRGKQ